LVRSDAAFRHYRHWAQQRQKRRKEAKQLVALASVAQLVLEARKEAARKELDPDEQHRQQHQQHQLQQEEEEEEDDSIDRPWTRLPGPTSRLLASLVSLGYVGLRLSLASGAQVPSTVSRKPLKRLWNGLMNGHVALAGCDVESTSAFEALQGRAWQSSGLCWR
jgi:hypothetical protein